MIWVIIIIVILLIFFSRKGKSTQSNQQPSNPSEGTRLGEYRVQKILAAINAGDRSAQAEACDEALDISRLRTDRDRYDYLHAIENASLMYSGRRYPNRHNELLEDLIRERIQNSPL